jgi:predicted CxxxxCH...CXXCH cytochrome family protein
VATAATAYGDTSNKSTTTVYDFGCANCHPTAVSNHMNGTIDITLNNTQGGTLKSKNGVNNDTTGYTQNVGVTVTCAASYCHSNGMATPTFATAPNWYATFVGDSCAMCHGNSPNNGIVGSAAHNAHTVGIHFEDIFSGTSGKMAQAPPVGNITVNAAHGKNNRSTTLNCNICHNDTVTTSANDFNVKCVSCHGSTVPKNPAGGLIANKAKHLNGLIDVKFVNGTIVSKAQVRQASFSGYTASVAGWKRNNNVSYKTYTSSYDVSKNTLFDTAQWSTGNCSNVVCHNNQPVQWVPAQAITCDNCHGRL